MTQDHSYPRPSCLLVCLQGSSYQGLVHVSDWVPTIVQGLLRSTLPAAYDVVAMDGINQWDALFQTPVDSRRRRLAQDEDEEEEDGDVADAPVVGPESEGQVINEGDEDGEERPSIVEYPRQEIILNIDGYDDRGNPEAAVIKGDWKLILNSRTYG